MMSSHRLTSTNDFGDGVSRRTFVKGLAVGGAVAGLGQWRTSAWAQETAPMRWTTLSGSEFDLRIGETPMNFTGSPKLAITVNGSVPAPLLRWKRATRSPCE
jgi:FtsP/CotA-like multicopper oxidase with cupredoxin domain